jgi:transcription initiation factor TFIIH subunit 2
MSSRRFIVDDDESLSDEPGTAARREHDPEDESDLDGDLTSDDDNAVSRRLKRNAANRRHGPVKTRSSTTAAAAAAAKAKTAAGRGKAWEGQFERTWDQVQEDEHGTLEGAVSDLLLSYKSRRCASTYSGECWTGQTHAPPAPER